MARRFLPIALMVALLCAYTPAQPARALGTGAEVQLGKDADRQVQDAYGIINDPLENAWVQSISQRLWAQTARKDVPYQIKVLDAADINAFTTLGGFIYINEGTLDFVQSDDELAHVIGHETGHDERRHAVTFANRANITSVILGVTALFSPFVYRFGQLIQAGMLAKMSRADESEADAYGVLLMTRAGFDPQASVTFMQHLLAAYRDNNSLVDKFFADHPATADRIKALQNSPELDQTHRTNDQRLVAALHNQSEARYNIARMQFEDILKRDPSNQSAMLGLGQMELAVGQDSKGEQTLAALVEKGNPDAQRLAQSRILNLRESQKKTDLLRVNLEPLKAQYADAQSREAQAVVALKSRRDAGRDQLKAINARIEAIAYGLSFDPSQASPRKGSRLEVVVKNFNAIARSLDTAMSKSSETIAGVGSLEKNKESGQIKETADMLAELGEPLKLAQPPPSSLALFSSYPRIFDDLALTDGDLIRAADAARGSLALLDVSLGQVDTFFKLLSRSRADPFGDVSQVDYNSFVPSMNAAVEQISKAAVAASQAEQLYDMSRARELQSRITMLGVGFPSERYETLSRALQVRFPQTLTYDQMVADGLTAGDVATATIIAADTNATPEAVVAEAKATGKSMIDLANTRGMRAKSLEMFLGLVYLSYVDDPVKEAHARN